MSRTTEDGRPGEPETATEAVDRKEALLPNHGVSPDYDDDEDEIGEESDEPEVESDPAIDPTKVPS